MEFVELPEFSRELKKLQKKYRSIKDDLDAFKPYLAEMPGGNDSKHWHCLHKHDGTSVYKVRLTCAYLRASTMRVIYAHHFKPARIVFIELYYKGEKENEDRERIASYIKNLKTV